MIPFLAALTAPFLSIGQNPSSREVISYFPEQRFHLERAYEEFRERLPEKSLTTHELLTSVSSFIREQIFDLRLCQEFSVRELVSQRKEVPLDEFIVKKTGVCRHFCLVADYFLEKLIQEGLIVGQSERVKARLPDGRKHAWNLLSTAEGTFTLDTYWGTIEKND